MRKSNNGRKKPTKEVLGFVSVGLDNDDGHQRVTKSEHFVIVGGSAATHERMQDTAIRFDENVKNNGKILRETEIDEVLDMLRDALE